MCTKDKVTNYDSKEYKKKCRGVRDQLSKRHIKYRIYEDEDHDVRMTVCIGQLPSGMYVRGTAICSDLDNFCRAVGQYYAMVRAVKSAAHFPVFTVKLRPNEKELFGGTI